MRQRSTIPRLYRRCWRAAAAALLFGLSGAVAAQDANALRSRQAALREQLANNQFGRSLAIESTETSGNLKGDVYAVAEQPYAVVGPALQGMDHWCDILMLHLNVKDCSWRGSGAASTLNVAIGRKFDQPVADAHKVEFMYRVAASTPDYVQVQLSADTGPLGTKDYRIVLEATAIDAKTSFVHMSYSYGFGMAARLAMQGYLATLGRSKVGFTIVDHKSDGTPVYTGNVRGVIERNAMRYYLAIDAYLAALSLPPAEQPEKRIRGWIASVERYPKQLREMEPEEYLAMKRKEVARQQASVVKAS
jgi:hypothetical protein